jgi:AcrR family transcriptional regulator
MRMTPWNVDNVNIMVSPPSAASKPDRAYHHGDLRNALIDAGLNALEAQDASELSLRALARDLGVSANAVYRHFADKDALLSALAAEGFRRFAREQREAREQIATNPVATGLGYIRFAQRHPALFRLMFGRFTRACDSAELQEAALTAFGQLLEDSRSTQAPPAAGGEVNAGPSAAASAGEAIDEATMLRAIARWSLVHGLSHLMLEGQLSFFGPGAAPEHLAAGVLMASGLGSTPAGASLAAHPAPRPAAPASATQADAACAPTQPRGKPSTNASS